MRNSLNIAERVIIMITAPCHFCATAAAIALFGVLYIMGQAGSDHNIPTVPSNIAHKQWAATPPSTFDVKRRDVNGGAATLTNDSVCPF
jgi:hypothetical protein